MWNPSVRVCVGAWNHKLTSWGTKRLHLSLSTVQLCSLSFQLFLPPEQFSLSLCLVLTNKDISGISFFSVTGKKPIFVLACGALTFSKRCKHVVYEEMHKLKKEIEIISCLIQKLQAFQVVINGANFTAFLEEEDEMQTKFICGNSMPHYEACKCLRFSSFLCFPSENVNNLYQRSRKAHINFIFIWRPLDGQHGVQIHCFYVWLYTAILLRPFHC